MVVGADGVGGCCRVLVVAGCVGGCWMQLCVGERWCVLVASEDAGGVRVHSCHMRMCRCCGHVRSWCIFLVGTYAYVATSVAAATDSFAAVMYAHAPVTLLMVLLGADVRVLGADLCRRALGVVQHRRMLVVCACTAAADACAAAACATATYAWAPAKFTCAAATYAFAVAVPACAAAIRSAAYSTAT